MSAHEGDSASMIDPIELTAAQLVELLPYPEPDCNKYTRGKLTLIGGSSSYPGAACLASAAAIFGGCGYVSAIASKEAVPMIRNHRPSVVASCWDGWSAKSSSLAESKPGHPQASLIGSGFESADDLERFLLQDAIESCAHPLLIDGGAISYVEDEGVARSVKVRGQSGLVTVFSPHLGEASRLAEGASKVCPDFPLSRERVLESTPEEQPLIARELANALSCTVMLKGPRTFIARSCDGIAQDAEDADDALRMLMGIEPAKGLPIPTIVMSKGSPALAKAGTGDVLAGLCASFLSQGMGPVSSCALSSTLHAYSAAIASTRMTAISPGAEEILDDLPQAIKTLSRQ